MSESFPHSCARRRTHTHAMRADNSSLTRAPAIPVALAPAPGPPSSRGDTSGASLLRPVAGAPGCDLRIPPGAAPSRASRTARRKPTSICAGSRHSPFGACAGRGARRFSSWGTLVVALLSCGSVYKKGLPMKLPEYDNRPAPGTPLYEETNSRGGEWEDIKFALLCVGLPIAMLASLGAIVASFLLPLFD